MIISNKLVLLSIVEVSLSHLSVKYALKCLQTAPFCIEIVKIFRGGHAPLVSVAFRATHRRAFGATTLSTKNNFFPISSWRPPPSKILDPPLYGSVYFCYIKI